MPMNYVVGRRKTPNGMVYSIASFQDDNWDAASQCRVLPEKDLITAINNGMEFQNIAVKDNKLIGSPASLERFKDRPFVIITRICTNTGMIVGYRVMSVDGKPPQKVKESVLLDYCQKRTIEGRIPIQNGIFNPKTLDKDAFIKAYPDCEFPVEIVKVVNKRAIQQKKTGVITDLKSSQEVLQEVKKFADMYTPEQREQLRLGAEHGVQIVYYANPKISWQKMQILREAMERGEDVRLVAHPDFIVPCREQALRYILLQARLGFDIRGLLNPEYSDAQLAELYMGLTNLLDINKYADPNLSADSMFEIRNKLMRDTWGDGILLPPC